MTIFYTKFLFSFPSTVPTNYLSLSLCPPLGNCLFHTYICTYYIYVCGNLLSHNLMALAFWLPFYAAGPGLPLCQLWQFMTNKHFYIALPAIYCSVFCTYQQQSARGKSEGERQEIWEYYLLYLFWEASLTIVPLAAGGGLWLWYSAFICINVWKTQTTQQTNKQTKRQQTDCECTEWYLRFEYPPSMGQCVYNARRRVHGI